jgi:hypothetical protein
MSGFGIAQMMAERPTWVGRLSKQMSHVSICLIGTGAREQTGGSRPIATCKATEPRRYVERRGWVDSGCRHRRPRYRR